MTVLDVVGVGDRVCFTDMSYHGQEGFVGQLIGGVELFGREVVGLAILHELLDDSLVESVMVSGHVHDEYLVTDDTQLLQQGKQNGRGNGSMKIVCFHFVFFLLTLYPTRKENKNCLFVFYKDSKEIRSFESKANSISSS
jgi:hypothetical protein